MREHALFHPREEHRRELEPLGRVQGHEGHARRVLVEGIHVGHEGDRVQERLEGRTLQSRRGLARHEFLGGRYELLDVLEPRVRFRSALGLEGIAVAGGGRHLVDEGGQGEPATLLREAADEAGEVVQGAAGLGIEIGDGLGARGEEREAARAGGVAEAIEARLPHPAARGGDGTPERDVVARIHGEAQIGEEILDLAPLVEAHTTHDDVGDARAPERVLEHARLRVGPVEDRHVAVLEALGVQRAHGLGDPARLLALVPGAIDLGGLSLRVLRPQPLVTPRAVVGDDRGGDVEDALGRAIVLLEGDDLAVGEVLLEVEDVAEIGPPPAIHGLVGVAHHAQVAMFLGQELDDAVLGAIGVLVLIDEHVGPEGAIPRQRLRRALQQLDHEEEQVVEVHRTHRPELLLVAAIELGDAFFAG